MLTRLRNWSEAIFLPLVGAGVLAYKFVQACVAAEGPQVANWREFLARVFQVTFRVGIGTLALVWMVIGLLWVVGVRFGG